MIKQLNFETSTNPTLKNIATIMLKIYRQSQPILNFAIIEPASPEDTKNSVLIRIYNRPYHVLFKYDKNKQNWAAYAYSMRNGTKELICEDISTKNAAALGLRTLTGLQ